MITFVFLLIYLKISVIKLLLSRIFNFCNGRIMNLRLFLWHNSLQAATIPGCSQSLIINSSVALNLMPQRGKIIPVEIFSERAKFLISTPNTFDNNNFVISY